MQKVGILGGGQLGRMLLQAAANYPVETYVLESDPDCPSAHLCDHFRQGDIRNYDDVYAFGKGLDTISIEIENVNIEALEQLEREGVQVIPKPSVLRIIKNKIRQKEFYTQNGIPTAAYVVTQNRADLEAHTGYLPAVHKIGEGGYDGKGVQVLHSASDLARGFEAPAVLEKMVTIKKEISQLLAVDAKGKTALYPPVEMVFNPDLNLLDYQLSPAQISTEVLWKIEAISSSLVRHLASPGLFAVELLVDQNDEVLVNETAPRVHNSGHHSIEAHYCSQFDMLWRILLGYPLGNTAAIMPSVMVNLVGAEGHSGPVAYEGLEEVLKIDNAFVHLYGKRETRPGRKMGHVTILSAEKQDLIHNAHKVRQTLRAVSR
ncbi:5-(carboxyamino)imidazole ribonucleotide synthase [Flaviaesturariibacter terrae]